MSRNPLYHFLNLFPQDAEAIGLQPEHDVNRKNQAYIRLPLRHGRDIILGNMRLQRHHISIYQKEDQDNPWLSQYHHTAYFIDDFANEYQSHVYFNEKESVIHSDFICTNQRDIAVLPLAHESISLQQLAETVVSPLMIELRARYHYKIQELETEYKRLEKEAEALSVSDDLPGWQNKLTGLRAVLVKLAPLVKHNNYRQIDSFINQLILAVNLKLNAQNSIHEDEPVVEPLTDPFVLPGYSASTQANPKKKTSLDTVIVELEQRFLQLESEKPDRLASAYSAIASEINRTCLLSQDHSFHVSLTALNSLLQLHGKLADWGKRIFTQCLLRGQFEQATGLSRFHYLLDDKNLALALHLGHAQLLAFILQYGDRSLLTRPLELRGRLYSSPVMACLESHSLKTPMSECFAELLKRGANMLEIDQSGLPVAHAILANVKHPMHKVFLIHSSHTLENPVFMKRLIMALSNRINSPCCSDEEKKRLHIAVTRYSFHLVQAEYFQELLKDLRGQRLVEQMRAFDAEQFDRLFRVEIYNDLELQERLARASELETHYLANCSQEQRKEWIKTTHESHRIAFETYPKIQELLRMVAYECIRPKQLEELNTRITKVTAAIELLNLDSSVTIRRKNQKRPGEKGIDHILDVDRKNSQLMSDGADILINIVELLEPGEEDSNGLKQLIRSGLSFFNNTEEAHAPSSSTPTSSNSHLF